MKDVLVAFIVILLLRVEGSGGFVINSDEIVGDVFRVAW